MAETDPGHAAAGLPATNGNHDPAEVYHQERDDGKEDLKSVRLSRDLQDAPRDMGISGLAQQHPSTLEERLVSADENADASSPVPQVPSTSSAASSTPTVDGARRRTDSQSTTATTATRSTVGRSATRSSMVFVVTALETIAASKDARKRKPLLESSQRALAAIRNMQGDASQIDPEILFEPLSMATEASTITIVITALDCLGKLISYSYFSANRNIDSALDASATKTVPLIERAIDTICDCFQGEATPPEVQMQILKSLLAAILNDKIVVHGAGLLKSVRQTYNIFLLSKSTANQQIAQGTLTQMVNTIFERVKIRLSLRSTRLGSEEQILHSEPADLDEGPGSPGADGPGTPTAQDSDSNVERDGQPMTLESFETRKSFDDGKITDSAPTTVSRTARKSHSRVPTRSGSGQEVPSITVQGNGATMITADEDEDEIFIRDAFLVFRAMCKLSTKGLRSDEAIDVKSQGMRSKLLSLHVVHTLLFNHPIVFNSPLITIRSSSGSEPSTFTQAVKQYLCLSLSRNGASNVHKIFEVAAEIFWLMNYHLRTQLKRELEVFYKEIYLAIMDKRAAPAWQKSYIVQRVFSRIAGDPKILVELYLNYDCDELENIYQRIIEHVQKTASQPVQVTAAQQHLYADSTGKALNAISSDWRDRGTLPSNLTHAHAANSVEIDQTPVDYVLKMQALDCLISALRSMVNWAHQGVLDINSGNGFRPSSDSRISADNLRESIDVREDATTTISSPALQLSEAAALKNGYSEVNVAEDDPEALERMKHRKMALNNAIRQFNYKPKHGIKTLIAEGFIASSDPSDIARFMLDNDLVEKKSLGEFLGEGEEANIKIMHAFVDQMDFSKTRFVDALRRFLQSFRLPGEAQKIDRLMLKFAERYTNANPNAFANADTAYVLAYSVILLNTDQHSAQVKKRMTLEDFIKNNRGINDNANLPDEYLQSIFDEIAHNEIVLDTEREKEANLASSTPTPSGGLISAFANAGRDLQREAYAQASDKMSTRTEQLFKSMLRAQRRGAGTARHRFMHASSSKHAGPMFRLTWMSFLTALSGNAQETNNMHTVRLCMEGEILAIRLACLFDVSDPRQAFIASLSRHTNLYNLNEMKAKNVEALKALLEVAFAEGNYLKESWRDVLTCISQLDRFQLISSGVEEGAIPDVLRAQSAASNTGSVPRRSTQRSSTGAGYQTDIVEESRSADMVRIVDRIFTNTANLSGDAIVHFVRALTQVSWQEIQSSGQSDSPRTYSLQKLVEISGYNMSRVRFEWTNIWQILGQHFIDVGCHNNTHVLFFALNSLRQLSMRFMELEELPGFKFQKDFLKPFELILSNASQVHVKDMVLRCLIQMIQARGNMIRSGWRTMFGVFTVAAREPYESIVNLAFENVTQVYNERFGVVISQGAFADLVVCLTEFSKNMRFQKKSLQAIETLKSCVPKLLKTPECPLSLRVVGTKDAPQAEGLPKQPSRQTQEEQYWFPVLFAFHDVLMTGEDLEVRSRALNYLFDTLIKYGGDFPREFWDTLWRQLLYPIFMVLKDRRAISNEAANHEELSVWLSTTLIQALRNMISLFTHFFEILEYMLDRFLDLLALCICQENDTLARIGSNCLQQLILQNVKKFNASHWEQIVGAFVDLFARTEARELFSAATLGSYRTGQKSGDENVNGTADSSSALELERDNSQSGHVNGTSVGDDDEGASQRQAHPPSLEIFSDEDSSTAPERHSATELEDFADAHTTQQATVVVTAARRRYFNQIITKCVLQLLMIETVSELFNNDAVYASIPSHLLLRVMALLKKSFQFAKRFNEDRDLRTRLFREGFMKQPPNLLKQESGSASVYVLILLRMHADTSPERAAIRAETEAALLPLCQDIIASYISLDEETQQRNIMTWRPVVIDVLEGFIGFADEDFNQHISIFAPLAIGLMNREMGLELQRAVQSLWQKICELRLGIASVSAVSVPAAPTSPHVSVSGGRRGSRLG